MPRTAVRTDPAFACSAWLTALDPDLSEALRRRAFRFSASQGQLLSAINDQTNNLFGVSKGALTLRTEDGRGNAIVGHVMGPGSWIGAAGVLIASTREVDLLAQTDCLLFSIPAVSLQELAARDSRVWHAVGQLSARNTLMVVNIARTLMIRDPRARCIAVLQRLVVEFGMNADIPITQDDLADMCSLSRGAISAILGQLERENRIERGYRRLRVLNF